MKHYCLIYRCQSCEKDVEMKVSDFIGTDDFIKADCSMQVVLEHTHLHDPSFVHKCCKDERGLAQLIGIRKE